MRIVSLDESCPRLVSDDEVTAAFKFLNIVARAAGREQAVPEVIVRQMLETAAMVRIGKSRAPAHDYSK